MPNKFTYSEFTQNRYTQAGKWVISTEAYFIFGPLAETMVSKRTGSIKFAFK